MEWIIFPHEMMFCPIANLKHEIQISLSETNEDVKKDIKPILRVKDTTHKSHFGEPLSG